MLHAAEAFGLRLIDHWVWLMGLLLMIEPLLDYHIAGFKEWADKIVSRSIRTRAAVSISVASVFVAGFLAFKDEYDAREKAVSSLNLASQEVELWKGKASAPSPTPQPAPAVVYQQPPPQLLAAPPHIEVRVTPEELLPQRRLTEEEKAKFKTALLKLPKHDVYFSITTEGLAEQQRYAFEFLPIIKGAGFSQVEMVTGVGTDTSQKGVMVGLLDIEKPSPLATSFMNALTESGITFTKTKLVPANPFPAGLDFDLFIGPQ